jgi:hypothetical protein
MFKVNNFLSFILTTAVVVSMSSCGGGIDATKKLSTGGIETSIPETASGVMLINTKQLLEKADYESLKQTDFFKEWLKEAQKEAPEVIPFLEDPTAAGISLASNMGLYFYFTADYATSKKVDVAFIFPIADKDKLKVGLDNILEKNPEAKAEEKDGYTILKMDDEANFIYNDKIIAFVTFNDEAKIKSILSPSSEGIEGNTSFASHLKEGKDFMFWMNADPLVEAAMANPMTAIAIKGGMAGAQIPEEGLKGNSMSFYYDFKDGEIDGGAAFDFSGPLKEELGDLLPAKLAIDYSKYIPRENLAAAAAFGINAEGVLAFVAKRGYDKQADAMLAIAGLDLGKINDGISGDLAIGVYPPAADDTEPLLILALGLKDKAFMEGLITQFGPIAGVTKDGDKYAMTGKKSMMGDKPMKFYASIQGDVIIVSNSSDQLDKAIAGGKNEAVAELQEGWMGMYFDYALIEKHQGLLSNYVPIDPGSIAMTKMMSEYNEVSTATILMKGDRMDGKVGLKTTNINSLKRLIQVADELFKDREKIQAEMDKHMGDDEFGGFDEVFEEENT